MDSKVRRQKSVVIVEDEEDILELVRYNLTREGFRVTGVTCGEDAVKTVRSQLPDLVLLDLMLPGVDGLEVCRILKNDPNTSPRPTVDRSPWKAPHAKEAPFPSTCRIMSFKYPYF